MERRQDIVLGLIFVGLGIATAWMATSYTGASGIYPMVLSIILALLGASVVLKAIRAGTAVERKLVDAPAQMLVTVVIGIAYVATIVPLGFYPASFLLMLVLPVALGFRRGLYGLIVAAVFMSIIYLVFSLLLEKPLPRGVLSSLFGLGG